MPNDFITVDYLYTFVGMVLVLGLIVQFTKGFVKGKFTDFVVRLYTFFWALVLVGVVYWHQGQFNCLGSDLAIIVLVAFINAILIAVAAMGGYEVVADPLARKRKAAYD